MIKMNRLYIAITCVLMLSSCATSRPSSLGDKYYFDLGSAALAAAPLGKLEKGVPLTLKVGSYSPNVLTEYSKGRFEVLDVSGIEGQKYWISVAAICDCLGFRKGSLVPAVFLVDIDGNIVSVIVEPKGIVQYIYGEFKKSGVYKLVIVADNRLEGEAVGKLVSPMFIGGIATPENFSLLAKSTGEVTVHWVSKY